MVQRSNVNVTFRKRIEYCFLLHYSFPTEHLEDTSETQKKGALIKIKMIKTWAFVGLLVLGLAIQDAKADKAPEDLKPDTVEANLGASKEGSRYIGLSFFNF